MRRDYGGYGRVDADAWTVNRADNREHRQGPAADRQGHGAESQQGGPEVHDQDRTSVAVADLQHPGVQVHLVWLPEHLSGARAAHTSRPKA